MNKLILSLSICCCNLTLLWAQSTIPAFINIKGKVVDTANIALPMSTIMLVSAIDNKLIYFTHTDSTGIFSFNNIKNNSYVLKVSYMTFYPFKLRLPLTTQHTTDIGIIIMKPIAQVLTEVIIKTALAPITFRGDTIEYNVASFQGAPGAQKLKILCGGFPVLMLMLTETLNHRGKA